MTRTLLLSRSIALGSIALGLALTACGEDPYSAADTQEQSAEEGDSCAGSAESFVCSNSGTAVLICDDSQIWRLETNCYDECEVKEQDSGADEPCCTPRGEDDESCFGPPGLFETEDEE